MTTLKIVYDTFQKWLHVEDTLRIDAMLATALTREKQGTKIWMLFVGPSGDWKSEMLNTLDDGGYNSFLLKKLTSKTLVSGFKGVEDLAPKLKNKILLITDMAQLITSHPNDKAQIWAQLRDLYDGYAGLDAGSGKSVKYSDLNITLIGASTPAIDSQILHNSSLGQRELIYRVKEMIDRQFLRKKIEENINYEIEMRTALKTSVQNFLSANKYNYDFEIKEEIKKKLFEMSCELTYMRAVGEHDYISGELINYVYPEEPTRIYKQLLIIYKSLKSLDENYPDSKALKVIKHIIDSSGSQIRLDVMKILTS